MNNFLKEGIRDASCLVKELREIEERILEVEVKVHTVYPPTEARILSDITLKNTRLYFEELQKDISRRMNCSVEDLLSYEEP